MPALRLLIGFLLLTGLGACTTSRPAVDARQARLDTLVAQRLALAATRYHRTAQTLTPADGYPRSTTAEGRWRTVPPGDWTSGFFPGILWQLAAHTGDAQLRARAHAWTWPLTRIFEGRYDHDLGFQFYGSFGQAYRITGDTAYAAPLLRAARLLAARFDPTVGALKSWDWAEQWPYPVIADNMMNLELLFWAAAHGGDPAWQALAVRHARTTARDHLRPDGGSFHVVDYDPATGAVRARVTHQGAADSSTWARGQAWLLYGFTMAHRETGDPAFLATARRLADYFIAHLPADHVPYWDFQAPGRPDAPRDASAAAIAASALLELSTLLAAGEGRPYRQAAEAILTALAAPPYLARGTDSPSVLLHAVGHHPNGSEVDVGLIYADYYFIEALRRYQHLRGLR